MTTALVTTFAAGRSCVHCPLVDPRKDTLALTGGGVAWGFVAAIGAASNCRELVPPGAHRRGELRIGHRAADRVALRSRTRYGTMPLIGCAWPSAGSVAASP